MENNSQPDSSKPPIDRLPPEILSQIFSYSNHDTLTIIYESSWDGRRNPSPSVIHLSEVCKSWRNIVPSTPSVWSRFRIDCGGYKNERFGESIGRLRLFLQRSKTHRLTFNIRWNHPYKPNSPSEHDLKHAEESTRSLSTVLSALVDHSDRWYDVSFRCDGFDRDVFQPFERLHGGIRQLKTLSLSCDGSPLTSALRDALLHSATPILDSVHLDNVTSRDILSMIQKAREIHAEEVVVGPYRGQAVIGTDTTDVNIALNNEEQLRAVFDYCIVPNLKSLEVSMPHDGPDWDVLWNITPLNNFFRLPGYTSRLTDLTFSRIPIKDTDAIQLLDNLPTIEELTIVESCHCVGNYVQDVEDLENFIVTKKFSNRLTRRNFLPQLRHLHLTMTYWELDQKALVKAVASRRPGSSKGVRALEFVAVRFTTGTMEDIEVISEIEEFADEDLEVDVGIDYPD